MAIKRNLENAQNREYWLFVNRTAAEVNKWPAWKRSHVKKISQKELLTNRLELLRGCLEGAEKELRSKIGEKKREINAIKAGLVPEIKEYRGEIKNLTKRLKNSGKPESPMDTAARIVKTWSPSKKAACAHRLGLSSEEFDK